MHKQKQHERRAAARLAAAAVSSGPASHASGPCSKRSRLWHLIWAWQAQQQQWQYPQPPSASNRQLRQVGKWAQQQAGRRGQQEAGRRGRQHQARRQEEVGQIAREVQLRVWLGVKAERLQSGRM